jgi:hypothetical protein
MSKKQNRETIRGRQESSAGASAQDGSQDTQGRASGHGGKVENDVNQTGEQKPTQRNEGQRTANSRNDRESHVGGSNQLQSRRGSGGNGGH